jgi:hypothetical protein
LGLSHSGVDLRRCFERASMGFASREGRSLGGTDCTVRDRPLSDRRWHVGPCSRAMRQHTREHHEPPQKNASPWRHGTTASNRLYTARPCGGATLATRCFEAG